MAARACLALLLGALLVAACGDGDHRVAEAQQPAVCPAPGRTTLEGGFVRVPSGARPGRTGLVVVVVPGARGDATDRLGVARAANRVGLAVAYPTSGDGFWALNAAQGRADVDEVTAFLDRLLAGGCFDGDRVAITGVSNGAGFATRMACELPGRFAAVVPVAAGYKALDPCPAAARTSFLAIHGTDDTVVPYNGEKPGRRGSVPRQAAAWARRAGCSGRRVSRPRRAVTRFTWRGCDAGLRVGIVRLSGTEHGWPGSTGRRRPRNPSGFEATPELIHFVTGGR